jgi:dipeptidyl aminopeptidase/acylaminoacyl peptidase
MVTVFPRAVRVAAPFVLALFASARASAQQAASDTLLTVQHYLDWETVADPQISPDGARVLYTRRWVNKLEDRWESEVWLMDADGSRQRFLMKGSAARWSPDGTRIAYLADGEPGGPQIHVRWMDAEGATSQVTRVLRAPSAPKWSPDGTSIAFLMFVPKTTPWAIDLPPAPAGAKWTEPPRVVDRVHYRQDFRGFREGGVNHLFVVTAQGGTPRQLTKGEWNAGATFSGLDFGAGFDWTPDGRTIVIDGVSADDWERRYNESYLYAVEVATGELRQIVDRKGFWSSPAVSPDGKQIAFTGYDWTNQTYRTSDVYVVAPDGSGMRRISGDLDRDPAALRWAPDGSGVWFTVQDRGSQNVRFAATAGGVREVTRGTHMLSLTSAAGTGVAVGIRSAPHEPPDVVRYDLRATDPEIGELTNVNDDVLARIRLGAVEEIWYPSSGGTRVQGWLVKPPGFDPSRKYPLILDIHGGPHAMYNVGFNFPNQNFAAGGYVVLYTNPRGSTGYGTAFGNAIDDAYPSVDYDDLMAGVDAAIARGSIDTDNLFVTGCSGGGVLTSWVIGHTTRFAAAGVRCPVTNWISFAGTTDITDWGFYRFHEPFWKNPDKWLAHSPLMYVDRVKTPTLIMTGEQDLRTPMAQSEEYYQALKQVGVETVLLRFNKEYHGTGSQPSNFMRTQLYLMSWFEKHGTMKKATTEQQPAAGAR